MSDDIHHPIDLAGSFCRLGDTNPSEVVARTQTSRVKLVAVTAPGDWDAHEAGAEMAFVLEGVLEVAFRDRTETVRQGQMLVIPAGTEHRAAPKNGPVKLMLIQPLAFDEAEAVASGGSAPSLSSS